jgi:hypothetical protein
VKGLIGVSRIPGFGAGMKAFAILCLAGLLASCSSTGGCCGEGVEGRSPGTALGKAR